MTDLTLEFARAADLLVIAYERQLTAPELGEVVELIATLEEGDPLDREIVAALVKEFPGYRSYDSKGNFIGTPAYENGWTA